MQKSSVDLIETIGRGKFVMPFVGGKDMEFRLRIQEICELERRFKIPLAKWFPIQDDDTGETLQEGIIGLDWVVQCLEVAAKAAGNRVSYDQVCSFVGDLGDHGIGFDELVGAIATALTEAMPQPKKVKEEGNAPEEVAA